jgi:hypothetical protein
MSTELAAYFDDSGHPDDQDVVLVAGWVGKVDQWALWEEGWRQVLSDFKIKSGVFHMTDFEAAPRRSDPDNEYQHLSARERQIFRSRLISHIATRCQFSFSTSVPMHDYKEGNELYYLEEWLGKPYSVAALGTVQSLRAWKKRYAPNAPLEVFFEDGTKHKSDLRKVFQQFGYDEPIFMDKKKVAPLQAADLLAWECFNMFKTGILRAPFRELLEITVGHEKHGMFTTPRVIQACEESHVPKRDPEKIRAFCYTAEPKVRRLRQIVGPPRKGHVRGIDRTATDRTELRFQLGLRDNC